VEVSRLGLAEYTSVREKLYAGQCLHARRGYRQAGPCVRDESAVVARCTDQFVLGDQGARPGRSLARAVSQLDLAHAI